MKYDFEGRERDRFEEMLDRENYEEAPPHSDADSLIIEKLELKSSNKVLTNDCFEEYKDEHPILKDEDKFIRYDFGEWADGRLVFAWEEEPKEPESLEEKMEQILG